MTTVLVVDDSRLARDMVGSVLRALRPEWTVLSAASGDEALDKVATIPALAIAIVDYNMPGMDGLTLVERLKERFPDTPMGLLTANVQDALRRRAEALGCRFIPKPITADKIRDFLAEAGI